MAKKTMPSPAGAQDSSAILKELEMIRRLLMLVAIKIGANGVELGVALDVSKQRVSQLIAAGKIKKIKFNSAAGEDDD